METRNLLCMLLHRTKTGGVTGGERSPQLAAGASDMPRKRYKPEEIVAKLRQVDAEFDCDCVRH
jgi:hypothetical protein